MDYSRLINELLPLADRPFADTKGFGRPTASKITALKVDITGIVHSRTGLATLTGIDWPTMSMMMEGSRGCSGSRLITYTVILRPSF
jgi:hypothetical protein